MKSSSRIWNKFFSQFLQQTVESQLYKVFLETIEEAPPKMPLYILINITSSKTTIEDFQTFYKIDFVDHLRVVVSIF